MRVLVVSQYFWPEQFRVNDLAAELVARGHTVTILTGLPNYPEGRIFPDFRANREKYADYQGADVVRVPLVQRGKSSIGLILNYLSFAFVASVLGPWKLRGRAYDAIFVFESSPVTVGVPAIVLKHFKKAPIAFWVLDLWPETLEAIGVVRSKTILRMVGLFVSWIYRHCDLVLAQSQSFIAQIRKYSGSTPVAYFPSWAETLFNSEDATPAPEVPVEGGRFNVMFAGNIGEAQDFPAILAAAEVLKTKAPAVRFLIVGDGRKAGWVAEEIEKRGLADFVRMLGKFPIERMPSLYKHADALLVSLKNEPIFAMTIPGKLQSYLAAGVPVVAMLNGEGADVVVRSGAGLVCRAGDAEGLANILAAMAALPQEALTEMARNARDINSREFDRATLITRLERWLAELSARSPTHAIGDR